MKHHYSHTILGRFFKSPLSMLSIIFSTLLLAGCSGDAEVQSHSQTLEVAAPKSISSTPTVVENIPVDSSTFKVEYSGTIVFLRPTMSMIPRPCQFPLMLKLASPGSQYKILLVMKIC